MTRLLAHVFAAAQLLSALEATDVHAGLVGRVFERRTTARVALMLAARAQRRARLMTQHRLVRCRARHFFARAAAPTRSLARQQTRARARVTELLARVAARQHSAADCAALRNGVGAQPVGQRLAPAPAALLLRRRARTAGPGVTGLVALVPAAKIAPADGATAKMQRSRTRHVDLARAAGTIRALLAAKTRLQLSVRTNAARPRVAKTIAGVQMTAQRFPAHFAARRAAARLSLGALEPVLLLAAVARALRPQQGAGRTRAGMADQIARMRTVAATRLLADLAAAVDHEIRIKIRPHRLSAIADVPRLLQHDKLTVRTAPVCSAALARPGLYTRQVQDQKTAAARPHLSLFPDRGHANHTLVATALQLPRQVFAQLRKSSCRGRRMRRTNTRLLFL